jgi:hypothetical protein
MRKGLLLLTLLLSGCQSHRWVVGINMNGDRPQVSVAIIPDRTCHITLNEEMIDDQRH